MLAILLIIMHRSNCACHFLYHSYQLEKFPTPSPNIDCKPPQQLKQVKPPKSESLALYLYQEGWVSKLLYCYVPIIVLGPPELYTTMIGWRAATYGWLSIPTNVARWPILNHSLPQQCVAFQSALGKLFAMSKFSYSQVGKIPENKVGIFPSSVCPWNHHLFSLSCFWGVP